jgi:quercetin dioxygenase-like cupin family protein
MGLGPAVDLVTVVRRADLVFHELPGRLAADPFRGGNAPVSVRVVRVAPGASRTPHRHPHSCEVVQVVEGSGVVWLDGRTTEVAAGDVVLIPAGTPHATVAVGGELHLVCFFPHPDLASNIEELEGVITL